jgi:hypothetical protein
MAHGLRGCGEPALYRYRAPCLGSFRRLLDRRACRLDLDEGWRCIAALSVRSTRPLLGTGAKPRFRAYRLRTLASFNSSAASQPPTAEV